MASGLKCVAVDLGAESCRVSLVAWEHGAASIAPVHRFANGPVESNGHLYWNLDGLKRGVSEGLRKCAALAPGGIDSIGIDGWAVDYVRVDASGKPVARPFCYRDPRTETAMPEVWERIPRERIYELTGIQFLRFNTLYQLYADSRDRAAPAAGWLNIPEYLLHRLGGRAVSEYTNATHTQLVNAVTRQWADEIFERAGLDRAAAPPLVPPGTRLGSLRGELNGLAAFAQTQLIAPACHDTGAAVAGIPAEGDDWAFISSGTWSLVGTLLAEPCTAPAALAENFTNEGGVGGRVRFLKNVNGMWLLEECLREWGDARLTAAQLAAECARRPRERRTFDVDRPEFLLPGNMPAKIHRALEEAGQAPVPPGADHAPEMAGVIFASLAGRYARLLSAISAVTGRHLRRLYVVGGGSQNTFLNSLIVEQTGLDVRRGAVESATVGNAAIQFAALEKPSSAGVEPGEVSAWAARLGGLAASADA